MAPPTARARARQAVLDDIITTARAHLADVGPTALSVRAVARDLGMVSSGIYRYVASRDELLTLLIVAGYERLTDAVDAARPTDATPRAQLIASARAMADWAKAHPHEYALLYGTPVPGYAAPEATTRAATELYRSLSRALIDTDPTVGHIGPSLATDAEAIATGLATGINAAASIVALDFWALLTGMVSLVTFGHTTNVISDPDDWITRRIEAFADHHGL